MNIVVHKTVAAVRKEIAQAQASGKRIGLVPTMGALHEGHASLIRAARQETDFTAVSIFVNPTQFGPNEDFSRYPRQMERDLEICEKEGARLVFAPEPGAIYPDGYRTYVEVHDLQNVLCGASRPGHFRGVATVVLKLFNIVQPDVAFFGQKDAQQCRIIQQMVSDLDLPVVIRVCPIIREPDGLAMSSRNQYLDPIQRRNAVVLFRALEKCRELFENGERNADKLQETLTTFIRNCPGAELDYAAVANAGTLRPVQRIEGEALLALAVRFGTTRLIDNIVLSD